MSSIRVPNWARSTRFRLSLTYSLVLFAVAALVLAIVYVALARQVGDDPVSSEYVKQGYLRTYDGTRIDLSGVEVTTVQDIEGAVNTQTLDVLRRYSAVLLGGLFLVSLGIGWYLSGRALRPVKRIAAAAREIEASDLSQRIRLAGPDDEFRSLADTIDAMLNRLDDAFTAQRQLIDDASHELRSPLTVIRTNLEAILERPDASTEERTQAIAVISRATARMSRLVEDLLATARRSAPAFAESDVDLAVVVAEAIDEYALLAQRKSIRVLRHLAPDVIVIGDHHALRQAIANLLDNALRLAPEGSDVTCACGETSGWRFVAVRDEGPGVSDADQARVFDRFWRADPDRSRQQGHSGLGLSIVRQIVEAQNGRVAVFSQLGQGSTFVLWLPGPESGDGPPNTSPLSVTIGA